MFEFSLKATLTDILMSMLFCLKMHTSNVFFFFNYLSSLIELKHNPVLI